MCPSQGSASEHLLCKWGRGGEGLWVQQDWDGAKNEVGKWCNVRKLKANLSRVGFPSWVLGTDCTETRREVRLRY